MAATSGISFREHWRDIRRGRPGHRFQDRYKRAREQKRKTSTTQRIVFIVVGVLALAIGVLLFVFPGPAIPFFFLGGALLASESRIIARTMDWAEVKLRVLFTWGRARWVRLPRAAQVTLVLVGVCCSVASAYFGYRLVRD